VVVVVVEEEADMLYCFRARSIFCLLNVYGFPLQSEIRIFYSNKILTMLFFQTGSRALRVDAMGTFPGVNDQSMNLKIHLHLITGIKIYLYLNCPVHMHSTNASLFYVCDFLYLQE
jgi:hypothetical protein